MRNPFDAFAQDSMVDICRRAGEVQKEFKIKATVRYADLWYVPDPDKGHLLEQFEKLEGWPRGFYGDVPRRRLRVVVVNELPSARETLVLRLYGAGKVLEKALRELADLPPDAPEKSVFGPHVVELTHSLQNEPAHLPIEKEITMAAEGFGERWKREILEQGIEKGIVQGAEKATRDVLAKLLRSRFGALDANAQARIDHGSKADLDTWLERFVFASSIGDIF